MKKLFAVITLLVCIKAMYAQNVGIGTASPYNKLQVAGNLLVNEPTINASAAPTPAQTVTMVNASTTVVSANDSTARLYDPGGPSGNYLPNLASNIVFQCCAPDQKGMEFIIESINLGTGDSLIIKESSYAESTVFIAVGNGYNTPGRFVFNGATCYLQFKSNNDASVGSGFSLLYKRLYNNTNLPEMTGYAGNALLFDVKKGVLRVGAMNNRPRGDYSVAMGQSANATGDNSFAFGYNSTASGSYSVALGSASASNYTSVALGSGNASGWRSTAFGLSDATANYATSMGSLTEASGNAATAMGASTTASGSSSTAMGSGSEAYGEASLATGNDTQAAGDYAASLGHHTISRGYAGTVIGMYNNPVLIFGQTTVTDATPLFIIGNGSSASATGNAMLVRKDGKVGIGTNAPATKLHIDGGTDASLADASGHLVIGDIASTNLVFDNNEIMARNNGATSTLYLQNDGGAFEIGGTAAKPGGGSWLATSDARLKQHISAFKDGLPEILKINPVNFHYNLQSGYDTTQQHVGVLAQELKEVSPYMVSSFTKDSTEYYKVDNSAMTYMLINAVKEQHKLIELLQARIEKLEAAMRKAAQTVNK